MTGQEAEAQLQDLKDRLRIWETKLWMRHAEKPTPFARTIDCVLCRGKGRMHVCVLPNCGQEPDRDCLHPNEEELVTLYHIQVDGRRLHQTVEAAAAEAKNMMQDPRKLISALLSRS